MGRGKNSNSPEYRQNGRNAFPVHKLALQVLVGLIVLATCPVRNVFAFVASKSDNIDLRKDSSTYSPEWAADEEHLVTVESVRVHYVERGTGRPVVMIHGNAGGVDDFGFGAAQLLAREYRVIAVDRPGHGKTDRPSDRAATVEYQAELLHRILAQLSITQPVLVGHSWGAALALAYALKYPAEVSAMVLLAPAAYPDNGGNKLLRALTGTPVVGDVSLLLGKSIIGRPMLKRALADAFYPQPVPNKYYKLVSSSWLGQKHLKAFLQDEWTLNDSLKKMSEQYSQIRIPVVIVTGDKDKIVAPKENAYRLQAVIPNSRLIELKATGHEIPLTHPESVAAAMSLLASASASMRNQPAHR